MVFIGHQKVIKILEKSLKSEKISQAYLFYGPESVGKFTLAKVFARCLIKEEKVLFNSATHDFEKEIILPDLVVIEPEREEKKGVIKIKDIKVEKIREIQNWLATYPYLGKFKVLIINDAQRMTLEAQNSLLKILEEPNSTSIIILVVNEIKNIVPTIKSRCQKFSFSLIDDDEIEQNFSKKDNIFGYEISDLSRGRPGLAMKLCQNKANLDVLEAIDKIRSIDKMSINEKFDFADKISKNPDLAKGFMEIWIWRLRSETKNDEEKIFSNYHKIGRIEGVMTQITKTNTNTRLAIENLLISF